MNSMKTRRTIRTYSDRPVSEELLADLLQTAFRASNTGNMQAYSVIVTRDSERKKALAPFHFHQPQVEEAPVVLTFCVDFNRITRWCQLRQAIPGFDNIQALTYGLIDTVIAAQAFCTAAEEAGLGICYLGTTTYNAAQIACLLDLPRLVLPVTTVTVGYPKEIPVEPLTDRLPLEGILHEETYHDYSPEAIDRIYAYKESLPENRFFVEENHKENLAQVFTDIRYTKDDNERYTKSWIKALKQQGFLP